MYYTIMYYTIMYYTIVYYKALTDRRARKRAPFGRRLPCPAGRQGGRGPGGHLQPAAEQQLLLAVQHSMACHGWVALRACVKCTLIEHRVITTTKYLGRSTLLVNNRLKSNKPLILLSFLLVPGPAGVVLPAPPCTAARRQPLLAESDTVWWSRNCDL